MYKIEKGIPVPQGRGHTGRYPFRDMEVGDSFEFPAVEATDAAAGAAYWRRTRGMKFIIRKLENGNSRCWRVE